MTKSKDTGMAVQHELDLGQLPGERTLTTYVLPADLEPDHWEASGLLLAHYSRASRWWVADWAVEGEARWGDRATQFLDSVGLEYAKISNMMWVARRVAPEIRRPELSFSHHEVVAILERPEDQAKWLQRAIDSGWKVAELRAAVKGKQLKDPDKDPQNRAPVSEKRQLAMKEAIEGALMKWWNALARDKETAQLARDQAFRAHEFERLANLSVKAVVKVLGGA